ncbi:MAG: Ferrous-iron efflux pump FieF [Betaproteobacteria bacterium ADurb.Bin341]|nr:MAG: Ferrous-iron efflux pump FieF [Betaproteobacteria bacterium ADurb.Bin341]
MDDRNLKRFAWLSIAAALATIALKTLAWWLTGSVGLLSDALESVVNLAGAVMALWMLSLAAQPADRDHTYGHSKAEYFASAFEGLLILLAAFSIAWTAIDRLLHPQPLQQLGIGLAVSVVASVINFLVARILMTAGRKHRSITLEADAHHLMTDVWTSAGVLAGIAAVALSGWSWLDPIVALLVAANIIWTGVQLVRRSADGLMDIALPSEQQEAIEKVLDGFRQQGLAFHALLTRQAGARVFISVHVLVPGRWTVQQGHDQAEEIEAGIRGVLPHAHVLTHLEPIEDSVSQDDDCLDRKG